MLTTCFESVWISGSNEANNPGEYGQKGVPNENNIPSARINAVLWMDTSGHFYLYGGNSQAGKLSCK